MRIWHCETQEQYDYLMGQLEAEGFAWLGGAKPTKYNVWHISREQTCVREIGREIVRASKSYFEKKYPDTEIQPVVIPEQKQDKENEKMNKQELITKFNDIWNDYKGSDKYADKVLWAVKELLEQLDEPKKVVLPKDVAEWLDDVAVVYDMFGVFRKFYDKWIYDDRFVMDFVDNHCEGLEDAYRKLARAYLDGYEVDKEKLYTVVMSSPNEANSNSHKSFLMRTETGKIILKHGNFNVKDHTKLTEAEIKSVDERYMAFAKEVTG
ncbi:DUF1642 domain-containing protein [Aerococcaceae bacterium NML160702]|nr:DUF1642 domain-containing protein [Aerococcaceae bacterium NML160702]